MSRMNKHPKKWQMFLARGLRHLPKPVALFIIERIVAPLMVMGCALIMAVAFAVFMAIVIIIAPFNPKGAREIFFHIMGSLGNE